MENLCDKTRNLQELVQISSHIKQTNHAILISKYKIRLTVPLFTE